MRGLISFSVYGDDPKYWYGALENIALAKALFKGWDVVVYLEKNHIATDVFEDATATIIKRDPLPGSGGMFWRFEAFDNTSYDYVISRDADSRLSIRDYNCVQEWVESLHCFSTILDKNLESKKEDPHRFLPGGAIGVKPGVINFSDKMVSWKRSYQYGDDELFLTEQIWPLVKDDTLVHYYKRTVGSHCIKLPRVDNWDECVGSTVDIDLPPYFSESLVNAISEHYNGMEEMLINTDQINFIIHGSKQETSRWERIESLKHILPHESFQKILNPTNLPVGEREEIMRQQQVDLFSSLSEFPTMILENDAMPARDFRTEFLVPVDCTVLYTSISQYGVHNDGSIRHSLTTMVSESCSRIFTMLGTGAILVMNRQGRDYLLDAAIQCREDQHFDIPYAINQRDWEGCYCLNHPLFYQADGRNEEATHYRIERTSL